MIAIPLLQRVAKPRRPFVWLALLLISASGLFAGVALHSLVPRASGIATTSGSTATGSTTTASTATNPVVTVPRTFRAFICPASVARGATLTLTAYATSPTIQPKTECSAAVKLPATAMLASGVACKLTFPANSGISPPPVQKTDATGTTTWQIAIPATTAPGTETVTLNAVWGNGYSANWDFRVAIT